MLAQRFPMAQIEAVEIDELAAATAQSNFHRSAFSDRMSVFAIGFEDFFDCRPDSRYDLIVSNPPFFLNSLQSPLVKVNLAKHTDKNFFFRLMSAVSLHLTEQGVCVMVLPLETLKLLVSLLPILNLHLQSSITIKSFHYSQPHRKIITLCRSAGIVAQAEVIIYDEYKTYTAAYRNILKEFLTIF